MLDVVTVLVVDDNAQNRALARATLEDEGFSVREAVDGAQAIAEFERERVDCIVMDVRMPGIDGLVACERIRALAGGSKVAIVFATALRELDTFDRAVAAGGDDFLTKPLRPDELVARLRAALHIRRLAGERLELVAELKQQRDHLQRLQYQKEQLATFLVHDLKNPVGTIDLLAQRILRDATGSERSKTAAAAMRAETRALMRMITNLLDVSKADEGRLAPNVKLVPTSPLVTEVLDELRPMASDADVELVASIGANEVLADRDLVHRLLANLVENALRHAPAGTAVTVALTDTRHGVELRVRDAGSGIPVDRKESVFDRFTSGDRSKSHNRGLGLSFCKLVMEAHGGEIWVEDAEPGAVFCARFPRHG